MQPSFITRSSGCFFFVFPFFFYPFFPSNTTFSNPDPLPLSRAAPFALAGFAAERELQLLEKPIKYPICTLWRLPSMKI